MSAWIVSDKCINQFLTVMQFEGIIQKSDLTKFGQELMTMNCEAVAQRYDQEVNKDAINTFKFKNEACSKIQAAKSLGCFLYQCCEGNIPEKSKLYKEMRILEGELAKRALMETSEYNEAEWSVEDE